MASLLLLISVATATQAGDWVTARSFYTHDPMTGMRTHQYAPPPPAIVPQDPSFRGSGFRHHRSTVHVGQSADNYHRVEQWGPPVQPYGEWRFPYRPYSVPYGQWGPPLAGWNAGGYPWGWGWGAGGYGGHVGWPHHHPGPGNPYLEPPNADGYYPSYPVRPRLEDEEFFDKPSP